MAASKPISWLYSLNTSLLSLNKNFGTLNTCSGLFPFWHSQIYLILSLLSDRVKVLLPKRLFYNNYPFRQQTKSGLSLTETKVIFISFSSPQKGDWPLGLDPWRGPSQKDSLTSFNKIYTLLITYTPLTIEPLLIALYTACLDIPRNTPASVWFVKDFISFVWVSFLCKRIDLPISI